MLNLQRCHISLRFQYSQFPPPHAPVGPCMLCRANGKIPVVGLLLCKKSFSLFVTYVELQYTRSGKNLEQFSTHIAASAQPEDLKNRNNSAPITPISADPTSKGFTYGPLSVVVPALPLARNCILDALRFHRKHTLEGIGQLFLVQHSVLMARGRSHVTTAS